MSTATPIETTEQTDLEALMEVCVTRSPNNLSKNDIINTVQISSYTQPANLLPDDPVSNNSYTWGRRRPPGSTLNTDLKNAKKRCKSAPFSDGSSDEDIASSRKSSKVTTDSELLNQIDILKKIMIN